MLSLRKLPQFLLRPSLFLSQSKLPLEECNGTFNGTYKPMALLMRLLWQSSVTFGQKRTEEVLLQAADITAEMQRDFTEWWMGAWGRWPPWLFLLPPILTSGTVTCALSSFSGAQD